MGAIWDVQFVLSEGAALALLELGSYAARVDGPPGPREAGALLGAAAALGLRRRFGRPGALADGLERPPCVDALTAFEREVAIGAAAWVLRARGGESPAGRELLDRVAAGAGVAPERVERLRATAERVRRHGRGLRRSIEFELLLLELAHEGAAAARRGADAPSVGARPGHAPARAEARAACP